LGAPRGEGPNQVYRAVRESLRLLALDAARDGAADWDPLGGVIHPGDTVVVKPNFVREFRESSPEHADCLITHGAIIRAVLDYALIALSGRGRLIVADAPHNDADFEALKRITGIDAIAEFYRRHLGFEIEVHDLRSEMAFKRDGVIVGHRSLPGDPAGYTKVDLGTQSAFAEVADLCHLLYGSEYQRDEVVRHHTGGVHEYLIARTVLEADCVISLPKLKTHKKTGLTVNLKNLVGINGNKNWLPHHREGTPAQGGDQFRDSGWLQRVERATVAGFKRVFPILGPMRRAVAGPAKAVGTRVFGGTNDGTVRSGNWHGNDTTWRTALDLNRILFYADTEGRLHHNPVRRFFSVVDGIVAGEGNGPLDPRPKAAGVVLAGGNPVAVDMVCARLMGFDYRRLPILSRALESHPLPIASWQPEDIVARSDNKAFDRRLIDYLGPMFAFEPHFGWKGHVELRGEKP
jgi:uncharacterized protein (DUF362 family)